ncbi:hypothetical protein C1T31_07450 [Hanstruepera neustonica]|uniref:DinB family protein n=1 Tax=Hanstruepera neustonica TaxID=1445657 RepID=A0A2K1DZ98_9FLAO|nr:hypothetical protein [Hanstruepera neustonica]PNQ73345.1 hypothetical protein C1T31_07450 [Hanstruepera neustonica]
MIKNIIGTCFFFIFMSAISQTNDNQLPYYEIPEYPESFTAGTVAARAIDGLGFRYYWATESLRTEDLNFKPNDDARSSMETIEHIYGLSKVIVNATLKKDNSQNDELAMSFENMRKATLMNFKTAADILRNSDDISQYKLIFSDREFPFWNQINGPIEDAVWHCGQVVLLRRSSGNPFNSKASVFTGKLRE